MAKMTKKLAEARKYVISRDNNRCCVCLTSERIQIHHRDGHTENNSPENLMLLCEPCHKGIHAVFLRPRYNYSGMTRKEENKMKTAYGRAAKMMELYDRGLSMDEIGKIFGISRQRVSKLFQEQKVRVDKMKKRSIL